ARKNAETGIKMKLVRKFVDAVKAARAQMMAPAPATPETRDYFFTCCREGRYAEAAGVVMHHPDAVSWKDRWQRTGLVHAAYRGHALLCEMLLYHGAENSRAAADHARLGGHPE